ncbi:ATP-binding protein [Sporosarcina contaminans]|uniref:ATP-binding protein n=1 Tax=Sporosarcina contaminans TaxID=633403 RepID=A0ABW3U0R1_9BACL
MDITLPYRLDRNCINDLMSNVINDNKLPKSEKITFDFSQLGFIEPAGITTLGNLFEWLLKMGTDTSIRIPEVFGLAKWCPIEYLDDSEFFLTYTGKKLKESSRVRSTTIPLQKVTYENSHHWLSVSFIPWLAMCLDVKISTLGNIEMCMGEIFNNIVDHSSENIGCIYAQHFPSKNKVTISIADFGIGIPENIRRINPAADDAAALEMAIEQGVSSRTTPRNMGAGLHTLISNVVKGLNGTVNIHSGYGILQTYLGDDKIELSSKVSSGFYPGTFLDINIDTEILLEEDKYEEEEEFVW